MQKNLKAVGISLLYLLGYGAVFSLLAEILPEDMLLCGLSGNFLVLWFWNRCSRKLWDQKKTEEERMAYQALGKRQKAICRVRDTAVRLGLLGLSWKKVLIGTVIGLGVSAAVQLLTFLLPEAVRLALSEANYEVYMGQDRILVFLTMVLLAPAAEEILFRVYILRRLESAMGVKAAVCIQAAVFACSHIHPVLMVMTFLMGIVYAILNRRCSTHWVSLLVHMGNNLMAFISVYHILFAGG